MQSGVGTVQGITEGGASYPGSHVLFTAAPMASCQKYAEGPEVLILQPV